jgi:4a-hydroxytetrahydrobiopterin dehydratase
LNLADRHCRPHPAGAAPLTREALGAYADQVPDWRVVDDHELSRTFLFPDFQTALAFVNLVGALAEEEGHHPDLHLAWGRVDVRTSTHDAGGLTDVRTSTHDAGGLTENDFILAAKVDRAFFRR